MSGAVENPESTVRRGIFEPEHDEFRATARS